MSVLCGAALASGGGRFLDGLAPSLRDTPVPELVAMLNRPAAPASLGEPATAPQTGNPLAACLAADATSLVRRVPLEEALADDPHGASLLAGATGHRRPLMAFALHTPDKVRREFASAVAAASPPTDDADGNGAKLPVERAYHGSALHRWHSILHHGLRNFNGKDTWNSTRSAFGEGIYASAALHVATDFASTHSTAFRGPPSHFDYRLLCVAAVDVARTPAVAKRDSYYVVQSEGHVMLRYLLLFGNEAASSPLTPAAPLPAAAGASGGAAMAPPPPAGSAAAGAMVADGVASPTTPRSKAATAAWWAPLMDWAVIVAVLALLFYFLRTRHLARRDPSLP